jgi:hypothetical protein
MFGGVSRGQVPQAGNNPGQVIDTWYRHFLGRPADNQAMQAWAPQLATQPLPVVLSEILASDEYVNRNGGTPDGMVLGLYRDVLGRSQFQLRPQDVAYWVNKMNQYGSREAMVQEFLHDANTDIFNLPTAPAVPAPSPLYGPPTLQYTPPAYTPPAPQYGPPAPTPRPYRPYPYQPRYPYPR